MTQTKYTQIGPVGVFTVAVERAVKHDSRDKMHYEYAFRIEARPTQNDFIDHFARLLAAHGKAPGVSYARMMGIDETLFKAALTAITGAGIREWTGTFAAVVAKTLLRETSLPVGRIASAAVVLVEVGIVALCLVLAFVQDLNLFRHFLPMFLQMGYIRP